LAAELVAEKLDRSDLEAGSEQSVAQDWTNNPKTQRASTFAKRLLWPEPHGVSRGHIEEFRAFSKARWLDEIENTGFDVIAVLPGPVASGYGFGLDRLRWLLERLRFTSEHAYVAKKRGVASPYAEYFTQPRAAI
jgi:hypothetical protein